MRYYYFVSLCIGMILLFQLQVMNYFYWLLVEHGVINGIVDKSLLWKTSLIIIPFIFMSIFLFGVYKHHTTKK